MFGKVDVEKLSGLKKAYAGGSVKNCSDYLLIKLGDFPLIYWMSS